MAEARTSLHAVYRARDLPSLPWYLELKSPCIGFPSYVHHFFGFHMRGMSSTWKPLLLHRNHSGIPPLLIKYEFGPSDYQIWLTDLSYIWTESLDRRQIVKRACNIDTSIDPSEGSAQIRLFFNCIAEALCQEPGSSVKLDQSTDINRLTLYTSTPLPPPLQPLEWSIVLMLGPQSAFASEFISPLLSQQLTAKVEKASLLQQLREKDNVISKLVEKVQGDGVDFGKLFPGAISSKSGAGPASRAALAKSIKGLREFDQTQWKTQLASESSDSGDVGSVLPKIFNDDGKDAGEGLQITDHGEWWKKVSRKVPQSEEATPAISKISAEQEPMVDEAFQVFEHLNLMRQI